MEMNTSDLKSMTQEQLEAAAFRAIVQRDQALATLNQIIEELNARAEKQVTDKPE